jgi:hypothetical protein
LGVRRGLVPAFLVASLMLVPAASARSDAAQTYPLVGAHHFKGTPLAVAFFDGGVAGRIAVMYEFNLKGIVRNSYAAVITSNYDIEVRADKKRHLTAVSTFPRPSALARPAESAGIVPLPDLAQMPPLPVSGFQEVDPKTILGDPPTETKFIFFVNDTTGAEKLVSNPEKSTNTTLIPGATAFQLSVPVFEVFPVGQDGHTNAATKQEVEQPPPTPNLDEATALIDDALTSEIEARAAFELGRLGKFDDAIVEAKASLKKAIQAATRAQKAGEAPTGGGGVGWLKDALKLDVEVSHPLQSFPELNEHTLRRKVMAVLRLAIHEKRFALRDIEKEKSAREDGT